MSMAAFQLDHDISARLRETLLDAEHDVADAHELGLESASDELVLLEAARTNRLLLTHNRSDFLLLHRAWLRWPPAWQMTPAPTHAGIIFLPQFPPAMVGVQAAAVEALLATDVIVPNRIWNWTVGGGWAEWR